MTKDIDPPNFASDEQKGCAGPASTSDVTNSQLASDITEAVAEQFLADVRPEHFELLCKIARQKSIRPGQVVDRVILLFSGILELVGNAEDGATTSRDQIKETLLLAEARANELCESLNVLTCLPTGNVIRARECHGTAQLIKSTIERLHRQMFGEEE